jgi:hypothetical protein
VADALVETVLSMLTLVCHFKKAMHLGWTIFSTPGIHHGRLQCPRSVVRFTTQRVGLVPLSMAEFSL